MSFLHFGRRSSPTNLLPMPVGTLAYRHEFEADFDDAPGGLSVDDVSLWAPLPPLSTDRFHLVSLFGYRGTWLDGADGSVIPDDDLHGFRMPFVFLSDYSEDFLWGAMVMPGYSGDLSGMHSDGWSVSAAAAVGYAYSPELRVFAGVYYSHGIDDDFFMPGIAFSWRPNPDWEVYLMPPIGGINYSINEDWVVGLFGRYDSTAWYVDGGRRDPDVAVTMSSTRVGLKLEGRLWDRLWLYAAGGFSFGRELEVDRMEGRKLFDDDIDATGFVQVGLNIRY